MIMGLLCNVSVIFDSNAGDIPPYFTTNALFLGTGAVAIEKWAARSPVPSVDKRRFQDRISVIF